ncbi:hypothetical protein BBJ28_00001994 [Nothophytophthora sp. Chile5]|nr:hypothetical protein BBJ28_00001994 [Nothophytophthora sp. Chile5]
MFIPGFINPEWHDGVLNQSSPEPKRPLRQRDLTIPQDRRGKTEEVVKMPRAKAKAKLKAQRGKTKRTGSSPSCSIFRQWTHIPRLVVFDLDFTLWFPEMYELYGSPFRKNAATGAVTDCRGEQVHFFPDVHTVLNVLETDPQFRDTAEVAVASRTTEPKWAKTCMRLMDVTLGGGVSATEDDAEDGDGAETEGETVNRSLQSIVDYEAIYPRNKRVHFEQLKKDSGVAYEDMLFFDNEYGNVADIQRLGVTCAYCPQGLTEGSWLQGMEAFQEAKQQQASDAN